MFTKGNFYQRLSSLGFNTYNEYLVSPHWRAFQKRYRKEKSLPHRCLACGSKRHDLHHIRYQRLGAERLRDVIPLCRKCHIEIHEIHRTSKIALADYRSAILKLRAKRAVPAVAEEDPLDVFARMVAAIDADNRKRAKEASAKRKAEKQAAKAEQLAARPPKPKKPDPKAGTGRPRGEHWSPYKVAPPNGVPAVDMATRLARRRGS